MEFVGEYGTSWALPLLILLAALVFGVASLIGVSRAKRNDTHSSMRPNRRMPPGARPVEGRTVERR